ncbi:PREDICTED: probable E3 ubiquitin-protein ligase makorin-1 isoform X2 [Nicrophorus vespilloides]|uniref:RING-type E3 ubiquitin transferase n=1 Tax=Nicrophorus vespilloides TaxID=110193 RepID=A0ABM1N642_NICVS|nr:PREDICTED: probable E3 ubiquitin-protein ligase makorin-1 isoform X2 [Nicrophorus vespilloides]
MQKPNKTGVVGLFSSRPRSNMAQYGLYCTQYLIERKCDRNDTCLFVHAKWSDVQIEDSLPNGSSFVAGFRISSSAEQQANIFVTSTRSRSCYSQLPCYYYVNGRTCPFGNNCIYVHAGYSRYAEINRNPVPSTSNFRSSASTSNDDEDDSCLGATALVRPQSIYDQLLTENQKNLGRLNIDAPEFIPRTRFNITNNSKKRLCPYAERDGLCKYPPGECTYLHGDMCDLCTRPALHPYNEDLRKKHTQECIKRHERDMEISFAVALSKEKVCGICFEVIMQKTSDEQRFGILPSCNHCFCLGCIRRWRQSKQFEHKIIRSCPECRIPSDFVCPSAYWVDTKEDKDKVIEKYKLVLSRKDCKYFKHGRGHCPFGNKCFYRHCLHNGKKIDVGPPPSTNNVDLPAGVEIIQFNSFNTDKRLSPPPPCDN